MTTITNFADDIFSITLTKPVRKPRQYKATWPCGSTWELNKRHPLTHEANSIWLLSIRDRVISQSPLRIILPPITTLSMTHTII